MSSNRVDHHSLSTSAEFWRRKYEAELSKVNQAQGDINRFRRDVEMMKEENTNLRNEVQRLQHAAEFMDTQLYRKRDEIENLLKDLARKHGGQVTAPDPCVSLSYRLAQALGNQTQVLPCSMPEYPETQANSWHQPVSAISYTNTPRSPNMPLLDEQDLPPPMEGYADESHEDEQPNHEGNTFGNSDITMPRTHGPNSDNAEMSPSESATNNVQPATSARSRKKVPPKKTIASKKAAAKKKSLPKAKTPSKSPAKKTNSKATKSKTPLARRSRRLSDVQTGRAVTDVTANCTLQSEDENPEIPPTPQQKTATKKKKKPSKSSSKESDAPPLSEPPQPSAKKRPPGIPVSKLPDNLEYSSTEYFGLEKTKWSGSTFYRCTLCNMRKFTTKNGLAHSRRHQNEGNSNRINCDISGCNQSFGRSDQLKRHATSHHGLSISGEYAGIAANNEHDDGDQEI